MKQLEREFPDISISKIRYLEDQKLLAPRRTPGGYRLYSPADVDRLRTILRLQRDEFLPLRVIRQELAAGPRRQRGGASGRRPRAARAVRRTTVALRGPGSLYRLDEVLEETGADRGARQGARGLRRDQGRARATARCSTTTPSARSSARSPS